RVGGAADWPQSSSAIETWVLTFAKAVRVAAEQTTELEKRLVALREEWKAMIFDARQRDGKVRATRRVSALRTIVDSLLATRVLTTAIVTRVHGVTATAAQSALTQLTEYGVLETISIGRARRAYVSLDVLDLITRSERAMASRVFDTAIPPPMSAVPVLRRV